MSIPQILVYTRNEFRAWLKKHHRNEHKVDVVLYKRHTGKPSPSQHELMEEAICFGWIDTTIHRIDDDTFVRKFSKRTAKSRWSNNTLRCAKELIEKGKMTAQGLHFYELGLTKPVLDRLSTDSRKTGRMRRI